MTDKVQDIELEELILPRPRKLPRKLDEVSDPYMFNSVEEMYRRIYFKILEQALYFS